MDVGHASSAHRPDPTRRVGWLLIGKILHFGTCPVCGYRNAGLQVGTLRPGMRQCRLEPHSIGFVPRSCRECGHPMGHELYNLHLLDAETTAALAAWQERQRARRTARKRAAA
jgi:hypothetical protein